MSPVTHLLLGWVIANPLQTRRDRALVTAAGIFPDIDGLSLLNGVDSYHKYHHTFGHNLFLGLILATTFTAFSRERSKTLVLSVLSFHLHLFCDLMGSGEDWGIAYLWPLSHLEVKFSPPFLWELDSWQNLLVTVLIMAAIFIIGVRKGRTVLELVSPKADEKLVAIIRGWKSSLTRAMFKVGK